MKETRRRFEWFSFYDHTGLEAHLKYMAGRGWLLEKIGNFTWHYRRVEPQKLAFSVCYFPKASQFDPGPSEEQETFYDFCAHTGWTLAAASAQMQIFYNQRPNPVPIDTDPAVEVDAIHRSAKNWLISQILLLAVGVLNLVQFLLRLFHDPIAALSNPLHQFALVCWPILILLIGTDCATYFCWRRRALKAAAQGEFLATRSHPLLQKLALAVVLMGLAWCLSWCLSNLQGGMAALMAVTTACMFGIVFLVVQLRELLKRYKASAGANRAVTLGACAALPLVMVVLITALVFSAGGGGGQRGANELPLALDDLTDVEGYDYASSDYLERMESPLLAYTEVHQSPWRLENMANGAPSLWYTVVEVKLPPIYEMCKNHLLYENDTRETGFLPVKYYAPIDPAPWGAAEAYQFVMDDETLDLYLLCYEDRIVKLDLDWELTPAQMAVVGEKLGGA